MSMVKTYLILVYDTSEGHPWILDSLDNHEEVWRQLGDHRIDAEPIRQEEHQFFELRSPLTSKQLAALEQMKQDGLMVDFYMRDEIGSDKP
jgi:hypothetical protein